MSKTNATQQAHSRIPSTVTHPKAKSTAALGSSAFSLPQEVMFTDAEIASLRAFFELLDEWEQEAHRGE